jgi:type I restriction enzyme S subunit
LGTIPAHWEEKRAKYFFREVDERSPTGAEEILSVSHVTGVTPRSQKNVTMFMAESYAGHKLCRPGDLVINTMWAWMAALGVAKQTGIVSPSYGVYRPLDGDALVPEYADAMLRTKPYESEYICRSTGIRGSRLRLYPDKFLDLPIACPPHEEQRQIVAFLSSKDRDVRPFIRHKRRLIELLNEQKQAIIHRAVTCGVNSGVPLMPSGVDWLGEVPAHWKAWRLKFAVKIIYGSSPHESTYNTDGQGTVLINGPDEYSVEDFGETRSIKWTTAPVRFAPKGSLLFCLRGSTTGRLNVCHADVSIGRGVAALVPAGDEAFFRYAMMDLRQQVRASFRGSTFPSITSQQLDNYRFPNPPRDEQEEIAHHIARQTEGLDSAIGRAYREIDLIREYRTRLITDIVTGKLDVRHAATSAGLVADDLELLEAEPEPEGAEELAAAEEVAIGDD